MTARQLSAKMRKTFLLIHRYVGLTITFFLIIVGLIGSVLASYHELDVWLNPALRTVRIRNSPTFDPLTLRDRAEALEPRGRVDVVDLLQTSGESFYASYQPKTDRSTSQPYQLAYTDVFLDPYTGQFLGHRKFGEVSFSREALLPLICRLHYSLAFQGKWRDFGTWIIGIVALIWTIDCFVGFYLTLPRRAPREGELS